MSIFIQSLSLTTATVGEYSLKPPPLSMNNRVLWRNSSPTMNFVCAQNSGLLLRIWLKQGKEKKLLARILKILEKVRKRLSRQNSTKKCVNSIKKFVNLTKKCVNVRKMWRKKTKMWGKRPEFYKKHWGATPVAPRWMLPLVNKSAEIQEL